ncbi:hypothetical protein BA190_16445 [Labrys sp. WJW]|nr:hypothetical protein BA190_16445 [Labrys sp. WJW]
MEKTVTILRLRAPLQMASAPLENFILMHRGTMTTASTTFLIFRSMSRPSSMDFGTMSISTLTR